MLRRISVSVARNAIKHVNFNNSKQFVAPTIVASSKALNQQNYIQKRFTSKTVRASSVAVVMSGAGFLDGTEITEAVSLMIHLSEKGYTPIFFSPNGDVEEVWDHNARTIEKNEVRNIAAEVARITRVKTLSIKTLRARNFDALIIPGGFGAAKILSNYSEDPKDFTVDPDLERSIKEFYEERKPIGAMCIAPVIVAKVLGQKAGGPGVTVTLGGDSAVEDSVKELGNEIASVKVTEAFVDAKNRVITTPAYQAKNPAPHEVHAGIGELVSEVLKLSHSSAQSSGSQEIDWDFQDYYNLKIKKLDPKEWEFIKKELKAKIEEDKKKALKERS